MVISSPTWQRISKVCVVVCSCSSINIVVHCSWFCRFLYVLVVLQLLIRLGGDMLWKQLCAHSGNIASCCQVPMVSFCWRILAWYIFKCTCIPVAVLLSCSSAETLWSFVLSIMWQRHTYQQSSLLVLSTMVTQHDSMSSPILFKYVTRCGY